MASAGTPISRVADPIAAPRPSTVSLVDVRSFALFAGTAVAAFVAARLGLFFVLEPQHVAGIWPQAGLSLGLLLLLPARRWPAVLAGVVAATAAAHLAAGTAPGMTVGFTAASLVEPLLGATLLRRSGFASLATLREVGQFLVLGVVVPALTGGFIGAGSVVLGADAPFAPAVGTWAFAHGGGALALAPLVLLLGRPQLAPITRRRAVEGAQADERQIAWARSFANSVASLSLRGGGYLNYPELDQTAARVAAAFPPATWDRLRQLKRRLDPANRLRFNANIPPADG